MAAPFPETALAVPGLPLFRLQAKACFSQFVESPAPFLILISCRRGTVKGAEKATSGQPGWNGFPGKGRGIFFVKKLDQGIAEV
jgi:hypothetical protein